MESLSKVIMSQHDVKFEIVVPLKEKGKNTPLFAIPGIGGNILEFKHLSELIHEEQPFYALQTVGLDGKSNNLKSIEKIAKANIKAIKKIQPKGPYKIMGYSFGGLVAYEMARILVAQEDHIESVIILDVNVPDHSHNIAKDTNDMDNSILKVYNYIAQRHNIDLNIENLETLKGKEYDKIILEKLNNKGFDISQENYDTFTSVLKNNLNCMSQYNPKKIEKKINIALFRADNTNGDTKGESSSNDYGWNKLLSHNIDVYNLKGDHSSLLDKDNVHQVNLAIEKFYNGL